MSSDEIDRQLEDCLELPGKTMGDIWDKMWRYTNALYKKQGLTTNKGAQLSLDVLYHQAHIDGCNEGVNDLPNIWLSRYLTALEDECRELREELLWKWWSKDSLNIQNIRIEIVDMLHFLHSLACASGLSYEEFMRLTNEKLNVNIGRQLKGYSKKTKDESDNKAIV